MSGAVATFCGWITIIANASGPIFDVYLLSCGLSMDAFVSTRGVFMLGSNMFKVISRLLNGSITLPMLYHGLTIVRTPARIAVSVVSPAGCCGAPSADEMGVHVHRACGRWLECRQPSPSRPGCRRSSTSAPCRSQP